MNGAELNRLAERVEAATVEDQRAVIESAAAQLALHRLWPARGDDTETAARFFAFLNVGAFESAAMTLVPEGWAWTAGTDYEGHYSQVAPLKAEDREFGAWPFVKAATPTLALTAACLRAAASKARAGGGESC